MATLVLTLAGCAKISLGPKQPGGAPSGQATGGQQGGAPVATANPMSGTWKIAFKFNNQVMKATMQLQQQGNQFTGSGTDDDSGRAFDVQGTVNGQDVTFTKQYQAPGANGPVPPVNYAGTLTMVNDKDYQGPYMNGNYNTVINGQQVGDVFEAQLASSQGGEQTASTPPPSPSEEGGGEQAPAKAPDLSGKWLVAYKWNFKTIKSTMFLEQDGGHLSGRGVDQNTNEKFEIQKGWYSFPNMTIVRTYKKGKGGAASDRTMIFRGKVQMVNAKDYQGPYMRGETQGGGEWEAQLVR